MQISFDRLFEKIICNFFSQNLCNPFPYVIGFPKKLNFIKIWQVKVGQNKDLVCYRQKQSFRQCAWRLRQLVLKPGFREGFGYVGKVRKISTDQYFLSYVKKLTHPPSRNRVNNKDFSCFCCRVQDFFVLILAIFLVSLAT